MKPHKHAELIKAWADGAEIECRNKNFQDSWSPLMEGCWDREFLEFRIKPQPKPDLVVYGRAMISLQSAQPVVNGLGYLCGDLDNVRFVFDGETCMLKSAEVI
jgi:hypothetical protein